MRATIRAELRPTEDPARVERAMEREGEEHDGRREERALKEQDGGLNGHRDLPPSSKALSCVNLCLLHIIRGMNIPRICARTMPRIARPIHGRPREEKGGDGDRQKRGGEAMEGR